MFETVVVATDGSDSATRAEDAALDLAARFDARLHAVSALSPGSGPDREAELRGALTDVAARADRPVETAVRDGDPPEVVRRYAEEVGADLVVLGTRGRGGAGFHLGSTAETVVREAPMPVLTVRGEE
jgi:nucleotide-binding universal stress UspA family protein